MALVSYDLDGVLAEQPPVANKSWGRMTGTERIERKRFLTQWYKEAKLLYNPPEDMFWVLSARKYEQDVEEATSYWLRFHFPNRFHGFYLLHEARSVQSAAEHKVHWIKQWKIVKHVEDNKKVLKVMRELLNGTPTVLYFWKDGMGEPEVF